MKKSLGLVILGVLLFGVDSISQNIAGAILTLGLIGLIYSVILRPVFNFTQRLFKNVPNDVSKEAIDTKKSPKEEKMTERKTYTDEFKKEVASAALEDGATLKSVGEKYNVNPTLVRNWKHKFFPADEEASSSQSDNQSHEISILSENIRWVGKLFDDGDFGVDIEIESDTLGNKGDPIFLLASANVIINGSKIGTDNEPSNWSVGDVISLSTGFESVDASVGDKFEASLEVEIYLVDEEVSFKFTANAPSGEVSCSNASLMVTGAERDSDGDLEVTHTIKSDGKTPLQALLFAEENPDIYAEVIEEGVTEKSEYVLDAKSDDAPINATLMTFKLSGRSNINHTGEVVAEEGADDFMASFSSDNDVDDEFDQTLIDRFNSLYEDLSTEMDLDDLKTPLENAKKILDEFELSSNLSEDNADRLENAFRYVKDAVSLADTLILGWDDLIDFAASSESHIGDDLDSRAEDEDFESAEDYLENTFSTIDDAVKSILIEYCLYNADYEFSQIS